NRRLRFDRTSNGRTMFLMARSSSAQSEERRSRGARLGLRVDTKTKSLVERAAKLESQTVTDFCLIALRDAARNAIEWHAALVLSEADRATFFDALVHPPKPNARLRRAGR